MSLLEIVTAFISPLPHWTRNFNHLCRSASAIYNFAPKSEQIVKTIIHREKLAQFATPDRRNLRPVRVQSRDYGASHAVRETRKVVGPIVVVLSF